MRKHTKVMGLLIIAAMLVYGVSWYVQYKRSLEDTRVTVNMTFVRGALEQYDDIYGNYPATLDQLRPFLDEPERLDGVRFTYHENPKRICMSSGKADYASFDEVIFFLPISGGRVVAAVHSGMMRGTIVYPASDTGEQTEGE